MNVYIDYIFLENFILDMLIIFQTGYLARKKIAFWKVIVSSALGATYVCVFLILKIQLLPYVISELFLVICIIYIAFTPKSIKEQIKLLLIFFTVSILNVGAVIFVTEFLNISTYKFNAFFAKTLVYMLGVVISFGINKYLWKVYKMRISQGSLVYNVEVEINDKAYKYKGFVDTGNSVTDRRTGRIVVFAEKKLGLDLSLNEGINIKIKTIQGEQVKTGYLVRNVKIFGNNDCKKYVFDAVIVFVDNKFSSSLDYDMILGYGVFEDVVGGIDL